MMKFSSKKEMEKYILKRFVEITDLIKFDDYDSIDPPDFVRKDGEVGIEITGYYRDLDKTSKGSRKKEVESSLEKILEESRKKYESETGEKLNAYFHINEKEFENTNSKKKMNFFTEVIVKAVKDAINSGKNQIEEDIAMRNQLLYIKWAYFEKAINGRDTIWQNVKAEIIDVRLEAIEKTIREKEKKVHQYLKKAKKIWLLIHGSQFPVIGLKCNGYYSSCGIINEELKNWKIATIFDHVFYFDLQNEEYIQLK